MARRSMNGVGKAAVRKDHPETDRVLFVVVCVRDTERTSYPLETLLHLARRGKKRASNAITRRNTNLPCFHLRTAFYSGINQTQRKPTDDSIRRSQKKKKPESLRAGRQRIGEKEGFHSYEAEFSRFLVPEENVPKAILLYSSSYFVTIHLTDGKYLW